jgi:hypothetical protein
LQRHDGNIFFNLTMDHTAKRYHRSAHSFDIRGKYRAASRLVVEQVQDDPRRKKTARRRFLNANLMIVDQAASFPIFPRFLRELSRPTAAKPVANSGRVDGISVAEIDPSLEIFKLPSSAETRRGRAIRQLSLFAEKAA